MIVKKNNSDQHKAFIYVADRDPSFISQIKEELESVGYTITGYSSYTHELLKDIKKCAIDLILLDASLPGKKTGVVIANEVINTYQIPVLFIMPDDASEDIKQIKKKYPLGYIYKPVEQSHLYVTIETVLYKSRLEKKMHVQEHLYSNIIEKINEAVISTNSDGIITFMNATAAGLTGWKINDAIGRSINNVFRVSIQKKESPGNLEGVNRDFLTLAEITAYNDSLYLFSKNGKVTPIEEYKTHISDYQGNISGNLIIFNDITDKKWSEGLLYKLYKVVEQSPISIMFTDDKGRIEYVNQRFTNLTGYSLKEIIGETPSILKSGKQNFLFYEHLWKTILSGKEWKGIFQNKKKNGELYWESSSISAIKNQNNEITNFISVKKDITDHRRTEEALDRINRRNELILASAGEGICGLDKQGRVVFVNPAAQSLLGLTTVDMISKEYDEVFQPKLADGSTLGIKNWMIMEVISSKICMKGADIYFTKNDGSLFPVQYVVNPIMEAKECTGAVLIFTDISDRKQAELELRRLNTELAEKNRDLEQIVYVSSHDLRSPLVNIQGWSKELEKDISDLHSVVQMFDSKYTKDSKIPNLLNESIPEELHYIRTGISKMSSLLTGVLEYSRLGRTKSIFRQLNMNKFINKVIHKFRETIKDKGIKIVINDLPAGYGDEKEMYIALYNILDNAIKYLGRERNGIIKISGKINEEKTVYCIEDNGIGIAKKYQSKIFEIFHRLDPEHCEGNGIGLTISRKIIEKHKGKIWLESEVGVGSKFYIALPRVKESKESKVS